MLNQAIPGITLYDSKTINVKQLLSQIVPFGGTSMRDAISACTFKIAQVHQEFRNKGITEFYPKIIAITDGEDNCSRMTPSEMSQLISVNLGTSINVITVDISAHSQDLINLKGIEGNNQNFKVKSIERVNLREIFERLIVEEYSEVRTENRIMPDSVEIEIEVVGGLRVLINKHFVVLFALDISESMLENRKWDDLKDSMEILIRFLAQGNNYVGIILFNHHVLNIDHPHFLKRFVYKPADCFKNSTSIVCNILCPFIAVPCLQQ